MLLKRDTREELNSHRNAHVNPEALVHGGGTGLGRGRGWGESLWQRREVAGGTSRRKGFVEAGAEALQRLESRMESGNHQW